MTGLIVGWRIRTVVLEAVGGFLLLLAFAYAISWVMALVGLIVPSPEVVNNASFIVIFPLTFIANTFVPTNHFPAVLKAIANWNPVSTVTQAARELFGNTSAEAATSERLADAASGDLHAAVVGGAGRGVRAAVGAAVPQSRVARGRVARSGTALVRLAVSLGGAAVRAEQAV